MVSVAVALRGGRGSQHQGAAGVVVGGVVAVALRGGRGSQPGRRDPGGKQPTAWRSPSGAAEDRNSTAASTVTTSFSRGGRPPGRPRIATAPGSTSRSAPGAVAVALRGGRGSQRLDDRVLRRERGGGGRPPGRPRIATPGSARGTPRRRSVAVALRGGRGSQLVRLAVLDQALDVWRSLSGAAEDRNAETVLHSGGITEGWRSPSGAAEDRNPYAAGRGPLRAEVAVALRGGRGSQHGRRRSHRRRGARWRGGPPPGRPRVATCRVQVEVGGDVVAVTLRGGRGSQHRRRRGSLRRRPHVAVVLRAAEDRNNGLGGYVKGAAAVAVALRGGRGSQPRRRPPQGQGVDVTVALRGGQGSQPRTPHRPSTLSRAWRSPSWAAEDRNQRGDALLQFGEVGGGRPPGPPRIATPWSRLAGRAKRGWRSSSGAAEDRNPQVPPGSTVAYLPWRSPSGAAEGRNCEASCAARSPWPRVAVALRGRRGSQRRLPAAVGAVNLGWRSPSGAAEDCNM